MTCAVASLGVLSRVSGSHPFLAGLRNVLERQLETVALAQRDPTSAVVCLLWTGACAMAAHRVPYEPRVPWLTLCHCRAVDDEVFVQSGGRKFMRCVWWPPTLPHALARASGVVRFHLTHTTPPCSACASVMRSTSCTAHLASAQTLNPWRHRRVVSKQWQRRHLQAATPRALAVPGLRCVVWTAWRSESGVSAPACRLPPSEACSRCCPQSET